LCGEIVWSIFLHDFLVADESGCSDDNKIARVLQFILSYRLLRTACPLQWWHKVQRLLLTLICTHDAGSSDPLLHEYTHDEPDALRARARTVCRLCMHACSCMHAYMCVYICICIHVYCAGSVCMCASVSVCLCLCCTCVSSMSISVCLPVLVHLCLCLR